MLRAAGHALRVVATASGFVSFFTGSALLSLVFLPLLGLAVRDRVRRARIVHRLTRAAFRLFHAWLSLTRGFVLRPAAVEGRLPDGAAVVVANHPTLVDITALTATFGGFCTLVKPSLFRSPVLGRILRDSLHVEGRAGEADRVVDEAVDRLRSGFRLLVFPEGTRSPEGGLHPFHRGAFEIARRAGVPLVPVLLRCDPPALSKGRPWYRVPPRAPRLSVRVLDPVDPGSAESSKGLATALESVYRAALLAPPGGTWKHSSPS